MKRSNSLPKNVFTEFNDVARKDSKPKKVIRNKIKYGGRLSLNKADAPKGHGRKNLAWMHEFEEEESRAKEEPFRVYNCLRIRSSCAADEDGRLCLRKKSSTPYSEGLSDREALHARLNKLIKLSKRTNQANVVVEREHVRRNNEDYCFGDVLWLILKATFAGIPAGSDDGMLEMNLNISMEREARKKIIDRLATFVFPDPPNIDPFLPSEAYWEYMIECRTVMGELLNEWEEWEALFPNSRAMIAAFPEVVTVIPRVNILIANSKIIDELADRIRALGVLVGADEASWPRPLVLEPDDVPWAKVKDIVGGFVTRSLTVKGMAKIFSRVSTLIDGTISRAVRLLAMLPRSYAQAAKQRTPPDEVTATVGIHSEIGVRMKMPTSIPYLFLLEGIRLLMLEKWLELRAEADDAHYDALTMETLIEDSRDSLEQAVSLRQTVLKNFAATWSVLPASAPFDQNMLRVFKKYTWYTRMWVEAHFQEGRQTLELFTRLDDEFSRASAIALKIPSASTSLCNTFLTICTDLLRRTVLEEWSTEAAKVNEMAATYDLEESEYNDDEEEGNDPSILYVCREYNNLLRKIQDRTIRVLTLIRRLVHCCRNAMLYDIKTNIADLSRALISHGYILVESLCEEELSLSIFMDAASVEASHAEDLLNALSDGRRLEEGGGKLVVTPKMHHWNGRTVRLALPLSSVLHNVTPMMNERTATMYTGDGNLEDTIIRELEQNPCEISSHDHLNQQLAEFSAEMIEIAQSLHSFVTNLAATYDFAELSPQQIPPFRFTMIRAFDLCMQVYRELARMLVPSQKNQFIISCSTLVSDWLRFLKQARPHPSAEIPLWAIPALTFINTITHPSFTHLLTDTEFQKLSAEIAQCEQLIEGKGTSNGVNPNLASPRTPRKERSGNREERLAQAVDQADKYFEARNSSVFRLGREVLKRREEYTVKNYLDPYRRAVPFKWRMLEKIGSGSFGEVYNAIREDRNGLLAVKIIKAAKELITVLESEVAVMRDLSHDNLVKYFGAEVRGNEVMILMEYCPEGTLESICREKMDTQLMRRCTNALLKAVCFIHTHHIVHRDIKPANIFLSRSSVLKLGDFGCARRLRGTDTAMGEFNKTAGTFNYMAPEVLNGGGEQSEGYTGYGRQVDVWSVGCVVYQMLTGKTPWAGLQWFHIVMRVGKGETPKYDNAPKIVSEFLDACFVFNPQERPSADALLRMPFANVHDSTQDLESLDNNGSFSDTYDV